MMGVYNNFLFWQPGLAGINLGKFLIKRVIYLVKKDMPNIFVSGINRFFS